MNLADQARDMVAYNEWANTRVLDTARAMSEEQFAQVAATFAHLVETQLFWHANWTGLEFDEVSSGPYDAVRAMYDKSHDQMRSFFDQLSEDDWHRADPWWKRWGYDVTMPLGRTLFQVVNHSTQHRSEVALRMTEMGYSPGELDYLVFREGEASV